MKLSPTLVFFTAALALALSAAIPAQAGFLVHRNSDGVVSMDPLLCLTDYQVRQAIARRGYTNIKLNAPIESQIQVKASRGNAVYLIDFNRCFGRIDGVQRIR